MHVARIHRVAITFVFAGCSSTSSVDGGGTSKPTGAADVSEDPDEEEYQRKKENIRKRRIGCAVAEGLQAAGGNTVDSSCSEQLAREEQLLEAQRTFRIENERDRKLVREAMKVDAEQKRDATEAMRRWIDELRKYSAACLEARDAGCLAEATSLCEETLQRSPDPYLAETCGLLREAHMQVVQAAANAQAAQVAAVEERQRAAVTESTAAPPWHCYPAKLGTAPFGMCTMTVADCKAQAGRAKKVTGVTAVGACKTQPLAACIAHTRVLDQKTSVLCFESIAACETFRADIVGQPDYSDVAVCDVVPTTWLHPK